MSLGEPGDRVPIEYWTVSWKQDFRFVEFASLARRCGGVSSKLFAVVDYGRAWEVWDSLWRLASASSSCFEIPAYLHGRHLSKHDRSFGWLSHFRSSAYRSMNLVLTPISGRNYREMSKTRQLDLLHSAWAEHERFFFDLKSLEERIRQAMVGWKTLELTDELKNPDHDLDDEENEDDFDEEEVEVETNGFDDAITESMYEPEVWDLEIQDEY